MIVFGILIFFIVTLLPGMLALRLLSNNRPLCLNTFLYAVGLGLVFNVIVGVIANFTFGLSLFSVVGVYVGLLVLVGVFSYRFGKRLIVEWRFDWKLLILVAVYLVAVGLQYQTTLSSPNLIGSDIHLEYYNANRVIETGYWDYSLAETSVNSALSISLLLPVYSLLTGIELLLVFKVIAPLIFGFLPLALYSIFMSQFGKGIAILAVAFFVTLPMYTMDMVQLIRQQHSELFFVFIVLLVLDDSVGMTKKVILGCFFSIGVVVTHYGFAVGAMGYFLISSVVMIVLAKLFKFRYGVEKMRVVLLSSILMMGIGIVMVVMFVSYYSLVADGTNLWVGSIPLKAVERTITEARVGAGGKVIETPAAINEVSSLHKEGLPLLVERFPFINPFWKEPLLQTAIGLDFNRASILGKVWRVFQYLVELCLIVGFFLFMFLKERNLKLEYRSFVITSFCVVAGMYLLSTYSYGMGATRVWQVTLIFMSPLFVVGASYIGKWVSRGVKSNKMTIVSTLVLLIPYVVFNSGLVFEVAKMEMEGFIDVPYSVALSGDRVDLATVFDREDVEAVDWLKSTNDSYVAMYSDAHGIKLLIQKFGLVRNSVDTLRLGKIRTLKDIGLDDEGYIFLRKRNVEENMVTDQGEYGSRISYSIDGLDVLKQKINNGIVVFDNGARIIKVTQ